MDKTHILFVRACKTAGSHEATYNKLRKLYLKYYLNPYRTQPCMTLEMKAKTEAQIKSYITDILTTIVDSCLTVTVREVFNGLSPNLFFQEDKEKSLEEKKLSFLISKIALSRVDAFKGFISPVRFRRKENIVG